VRFQAENDIESQKSACLTQSGYIREDDSPTLLFAAFSTGCHGGAIISQAIGWALNAGR
jgi:hypothetical protein